MTDGAHLTAAIALEAAYEHFLRFHPLTSRDDWFLALVDFSEIYNPESPRYRPDWLGAEICAFRYETVHPMYWEQYSYARADVQVGRGLPPVRGEKL